MATVFLQLDPIAAQFLAANFPQFNKINGTAYPVPGLAFDASAKETAFWGFRADNYGSGNLTLDLDWYADTASSGDIIWGAQLAAITPNTDTQDTETRALAAANTVTQTHLGATGQRLHRATITLSNLDTLASKDEVFLAIYRDAAAGGDTMTGDAILLRAVLSYSDT